MIDTALLKAMAKAGVTADQIAIIATEYEAATAESRAEKREQNRIRQQNHRERNASSRVTECDTPALDKEKSPTPPKEIKPSPNFPLVGSRAQFAEFWDLFPNKVGKRTAEREFTFALQRASFEEIIAGLRRYVDKTDDRPWCNPSTFLHQNRWDDQPASATRRQNGHSPPTHAEQVDDVLSKIINGKSHEHPGPTIDASYDRTDRDGTSRLVQFDAFAARR